MSRISFVATALLLFSSGLAGEAAGQSPLSPVAGSRARPTSVALGNMGRLLGQASVPATAHQGIAMAKSSTKYEPSATDPRIMAALAAQAALGDAMRDGDVAAIERLFASDLIVNAPIGRTVGREDVLARYRSGQIGYEPNVVRVIEFAGVRGDAVVITGEEIVRPIGAAPNAGKIVHRRYTDIWKIVDHNWVLSVRQATITLAE